MRLGNDLGSTRQSPKELADEGMSQLYTPQQGESSVSVGRSGASDTMLQASRQESKEVSAFSVLSQVFPPFLLAGLGMVAAGLLLDRVHHWPVFQQVKEIMILVPALLGLKGNLEMTLAARLATHSNLNELNANSSLYRIAIGNLALVQVQAIAVGGLASVVSVILAHMVGLRVSWTDFLLMASTSVCAASAASLVLATIMIIVVVTAHRNGIDPDNIASPIADMLGDFCTLGLVSLIATFFYDTREEFWELQLITLLTFALVLPLLIYVVRSCPETASTLQEGWKPIIVAMGISCGGGLILRFAVHSYPGLASFAPVMNGTGGNLAAVQISRLSTHLHGRAVPGMDIYDYDEPGDRDDVQASSEKPKAAKASFWLSLSWLSRCCSVLGSSSHARTARVLVLMSLPGSLIFSWVITFITSRTTTQASPGPTFYFAYEAAAFTHVCLLMALSQNLVICLWRNAIDPDNAAIPYVTSLGDVLGSAILAFTFWVLTVNHANPFIKAAVAKASVDDVDIMRL